MTFNDECPRRRESQISCRPVSSATFACVCLNEWNARFSPVGPTRGIPARMVPPATSIALTSSRSTTGEVNDDALAHAAVPDLLADLVADGIRSSVPGSTGTLLVILTWVGCCMGFLVR